MPIGALTSLRWRENASVTFTPENRPAVGSDGVVASTQSMGSAAGAQIIASGGNAIDAAVATLFALSVVEPMKMGIYGAGFMNIRLADGRRIAIDNYSQAPGAATMDMFTPLSDEWPNYMRARGDLNQTGVLASGVPGALKAWCEIHAEFGNLSLTEVMAPAISHAEYGFRATEHYCKFVEDNSEALRQFSASASIFMPGGRVPKAGDLVVQRDLASTLKRIALEGADYLYGGELGLEIVRYSQANGGIITMDDLLRYRVRRNDPIAGTYRGYTLTGPLPSSAGGLHLIEFLNVLALRDIGGMGFGRSSTIHLMAEVMQLVFADRNRYLSDPEFVEIPFDRLLSDFHAKELMSQILPNAVMPELATPALAESESTSHVTTADRAGNIVAATQTVNHIFGSKVVVPGTGVLLDNTMANFDPHPNLANSVEPCKRVASSMSPVIAYRGSRPAFALGLPGGIRIWTSVAQAIINIADHGMTAQEAVEAPRMFTQGQEVELEQEFGSAIADSLRNIGHDVTMVTNVAGGMNIIEFGGDSTLAGSSCWRSDGGAVAVSRGEAREGVGLTVFEPSRDSGSSN